MAFFQFYPEPTRRTCKSVKAKWVEECNLRVDFIYQTRAGQWDDAKITQKKLDGIYVDSKLTFWEPPIKITPPKRTAPRENPYMKEHGDYTLTDAELMRLKDSLNNRDSETEKKALLYSWYVAKKSRLEKGFVSESELPYVRAYFANRISD